MRAAVGIVIVISCLPLRILVAQGSAPSRHDVFLPVIGSAPETGLQLGATWLRAYWRGPGETTRPSRIQVALIATTHHQRRISASVDTWSSGNARRHRVSVEAQYYPLPVFGIGAEAPDEAEGRYTATGIDAQWLFQQRVIGPIYAGATLRYDGLRARDEDFSAWESLYPRPPLRTHPQVKAQAMLVRDTRDHQVAARAGALLQVVGGTATDRSAGSTRTSARLSTDFRRYLSLPAHGVLALQAAGTAMLRDGDVPDYFAALGADTLMRGYVRDRFRDKAAVAAQAEWRSGFVGRVGFVAFGSAGALGARIGDLGSHGAVFAGGAGLRFRLSEADRSRIRVDYARGRQGGALYVALGEAF
ncbi:MAG: hypothetical protein IT361_07840 [Gemmatimonadaceae bacterium]|nr:hypothetical protein [Gemmatimonadaceae bacterium]